MRPARNVRILWLFAALLLGMKALVPAGWMPVRSQDGVTIALCTGHGPAVITLDLESDGQPGQPDQSAHHDPCPYAPLSQAALASDPPLLAADEALPFAVYDAPPMRSLPLALHAPRPPTRGPPLLA